MSSRPAKPASLTIVCITLCMGCLLRADQERYGKFEQERALGMLHTVESDLKKNYYDPKFHGLDVDARFREAEQKIVAAKSMNEAFSDIAGAMLALDDSHTFFIPPPRPYTHDYGWRMQTVGDTDVFVTAVRPGTDAESKGVHVGDQVVGVNKYDATRENLWTLMYMYDVLRPQPSLRLALRAPSGAEKELSVQAEEHMGQRYTDWMVASSAIGHFEREAEDDANRRKPRFVEYGKEAIICRVYDFEFNPDRVDDLLDRLRSHQGIIIDVRGNPGGYVVTAERFIGGFFDHDVKMADRRGRKDLKPSMTKSRGGKTVMSKVIVLIDGGSASAAEIFARMIQLEKRGTIIGDRSSGSVMEARSFSYTSGVSQGTFYGASITDADMIMADGKSLEKTGVMPDERVVPTAKDLAASRDPVLARAAELIGVKLSAEDAGKLFPFQWPKT